MNRRSFFKVITGFVVGVVAVLVPKTNPDVIIFPTEKQARKFSQDRIKPTNIPTMSAKDWVDAQFNPVKELQVGEPFEGKIVSMCNFEGTLWIATEKGVYRIKGINNET